MTKLEKFKKTPTNQFPKSYLNNILGWFKFGLPKKQLFPASCKVAMAACDLGFKD